MDQVWLPKLSWEDHFLGAKLGTAEPLINDTLLAGGGGGGGGGQYRQLGSAKNDLMDCRGLVLP